MFDRVLNRPMKDKRSILSSPAASTHDPSWKVPDVLMVLSKMQSYFTKITVKTCTQSVKRQWLCSTLTSFKIHTFLLRQLKNMYDLKRGPQNQLQTFQKTRILLFSEVRILLRPKKDLQFIIICDNKSQIFRNVLNLFRK